MKLVFLLEERSKLRAWKDPEAHFVIIRDQDNEDCLRIKERLRQMCVNAGRPETLIRIACHELEAWFLGDLLTAEAVFGTKNLARQQNSRKFRTPDRLGVPSRELASLVEGYGKVQGARKMGEAIDPSRCLSHSFQVFVSGIQRLIADHPPPETQAQAQASA